MNLESGVSLGELLLSLAAVLVSGGVAWGGVVQRIKTLELEVSAMKDLDVRVARIETKLDGLVEQLRDLAASVRWMRDPAPPYQPGPLPGVSQPGPRR